MSYKRFGMIAVVASVLLAGCRQRPVLVEGGCPQRPPSSDRIRIAHRRFPGSDAGRAVFVVQMESGYPSMGHIPDAYILLKSAAHPEAVSSMTSDSLHVGTYAHQGVPGVYTVLARRVGFFPVVDTVRLDGGWIDSATYHTVVDVVCLSSAASTLSASPMLPNER